MTCRCNDTGRVLAERNKGTVEAACGRCTPTEIKLLWEWVRELRREVDELKKRLDDKGGAS